MHILFITHYFEPGEGEAAIRLSQLAKLFQARGHRITVLTTMPHYPKGVIDDAYQGKWWQVEERDGVRVIYVWLWATMSLRISRRLLSQFSFLPIALLRGLALPRPDVTYIEAQPIFTGIAGRILSRLKRAPYVLNVSDLWPDHLLTVGALKETDRVYQIARAAMDSGYRGAAGIICMSPAWARKVAQYIGGHEEKIHTIYRGVPLQKFHPHQDTTTFRAKYQLSDEKLVTFIGTFATQYDFDLMLDAIAHYQRRQDVQFVIIGTGSQRDKLQARINTGEFSNLKWIDWLEHEEMPAAWHASYFNLWALRDETLYNGTIPAKIYEAFAAGTPVVAAQRGECAAIIAEANAGLTVEPGDMTGFINIIGRLLDDESLRAEYSKNARQYAEQHFDFDRAVNHHEEILLKAARQK